MTKRKRDFRSQADSILAEGGSATPNAGHAARRKSAPPRAPERVDRAAQTPERATKRISTPDRPAVSSSEEAAAQPELFDPPPQAPKDAKMPPLPGRPREVAARKEGLPPFAPPPPTPPALVLPASAFSRSESSGEKPSAKETYSPPPAVVPQPPVVKLPTPTYSPPPPPRRVLLGTTPETPYSPAPNAAPDPVPNPAPTPVTTPSRPVSPFASATLGAPTADAVTVVEVAAPDDGGIREAVLAADRSESPPSPAPAKRTGSGHPVVRTAKYSIVVLALTGVFLFLLIDFFRLG